MSKDVLLSEATLTLNGESIVDLVDGDIISLISPNNTAESITGKNGNSIVTLNPSGDRGEMTLRLLLGSSNDNHPQTRYRR